MEGTIHFEEAESMLRHRDLVGKVGWTESVSTEHNEGEQASASEGKWSSERCVSTKKKRDKQKQ